MSLLIFRTVEYLFEVVSVSKYIVSSEIISLMSISDGIGLSLDVEDAAYEGRDG